MLQFVASNRNFKANALIYQMAMSDYLPWITIFLTKPRHLPEVAWIPSAVGWPCRHQAKIPG